MDANERKKKFDEYIKTATIVISAADFIEVLTKTAAEEPFRSLRAVEPILESVLPMYAAKILSNLIPNPLKKDDESEEN